MEENIMPEQKPIKITETVLRDAHQSLIATRMPTELMLPIVEKMDKVGYHSVELRKDLSGNDRMVKAVKP